MSSASISVWLIPFRASLACAVQHLYSALSPPGLSLLLLNSLLQPLRYYSALVSREGSGPELFPASCQSTGEEERLPEGGKTPPD